MIYVLALTLISNYQNNLVSRDTEMAYRVLSTSGEVDFFSAAKSELLFTRTFSEKTCFTDN